jgi:hypothetical protein
MSASSLALAPASPTQGLVRDGSYEASSLRGFPIEAGLAVLDSNEVRSWLIKPTEEWLGRKLVGDPWRKAPPLWDPKAEKLHGISLEQLQSEGLPWAPSRSRAHDPCSTVAES